MLIQADARHIPLADESVQCVVTSPHNRNPKPFWDRAWFVTEYVEKGRSSMDIAKQFGVRDSTVQWWFKKHGIKSRSVSEARKLKHWGSCGKSNPMFGKTGELNPNYKDGSSPERQRLYVQAEGRKFLQAIYTRDGFQCRRCGMPKGKPKSLHAHHIKPWAGNPELRFAMDNAVTLCRPCHSWVHSKKNTEKEFLVG